MSVSSQAHQQPEQSQAVLAIAQAIEQLAETQFSGSLNCDAAHVVQLRLFFVAGRLVWAGGGMHRLRRWRRLLKQICPEAIFALAQLTPAVSTPTWEYEALRGLLKQAHISRDQARALIRQQISEVLFDIVQSWSLAESHEAQVEETFRIKDAITLIPVQDLLPEVFAQWQEWSDAGMRLYSPNLSPLLDDPAQLQAQVSAGTFVKLQQMLRGQHSLRELASLVGQDVSKLSQALFVYEQKRLLQMRATLDMSGSIPTPSARGAELAALNTLNLGSVGSMTSLAESLASSRLGRGRVSQAGEVAVEPSTSAAIALDSGFFDSRSFPAKTAAKKSVTEKTTAIQHCPSEKPSSIVSNTTPLIVCIDDNERVRERIGLILTQQGYRYRGIADPTETLPTVIELRPSLVFIDLVMPNLSGYDICGQIRRVESLQNIPLIILTGTDTMLDRMRGKLAGATAYLTKPISPKEILAVVSQQLEARVS